ncbi:hypothetical protein Rhal01_01353 [Rubritalea halochordaticola]|uniref:Cytochrome c family protein n=1 Tax=Rubritalea halochordaticola TaxID=714537 RepID=A0ABP9UY57_9BACT
MTKKRITLATLGCGMIGAGALTLLADDQSTEAVQMPTYPASCDTSTLPNGYVYPDITSTMPYDRHSLETGTKTDAKVADDCGVFETQKQFDLFSWATFVALNWPADDQGNPKGDSISAHPDAPRVWETYLSPTQIFKADGSTPDAWGTPEHKHEDGKPKRVLLATSKKTHRPHVLDEVNEAFFNNETPLPPIVDLNKEYVRYEIRINKAEYEYILSNKLYNQEGQANFLKVVGNQISFPSGQSGATPQFGAMELKVAWKKLTDDEVTSKKFYTIKPEVYHPYSKKYTHGHHYGLVGMHIMVRTKDASEWVWATFEHVDNAPRVDLRGNGTRKVDYDPSKEYNFWSQDKGKASIAGFSDASYAAMLKAQKTNEAAGKPAADYSQEKADRIPSQITQVITSNNDVIDSTWTNSLNAEMQKKLKGTVWENYRLISTQWPVDSGTGRAGNPAPISLGNPVMETYMQVNGSCMNCHAGATFGPLNSDGVQTNMANFSFMLQRAHKTTTSTTKNDSNE